MGGSIEGERVLGGAVLGGGGGGATVNTKEAVCSCAKTIPSFTFENKLTEIG